MKTIPYWLDTAEPAGDYTRTELPDRVDVAVIGAGLTGSSAALALARKGASVAVLEAGQVGHGASGRNGGMCTTGMAIGFGVALERYGMPTAGRLHLAYNDAIDMVEKLVTDESIACNFARTGKLNLASKPAHFEWLAKTHELLAERLDYETELVPRARLHTEVGSDYYHGGLVDPKGAGLHVGKFVHGLAAAAVRHGATVHERARVTGLRRLDGTRHLVTTTRGMLEAGQVLLATNGYTGRPFGWFRRRIVPIGSFIVVTEPLSTEQVDELMPTRRMAGDSKNLLYYFRITPDQRLLFGGRARFAMSNPRSDRRSGDILRRGIGRVFPQLASCRIDYVWGGLVGMTLDRLPHAGERNGLYYTMGYSGHGVQMSTYMGHQMAEVMDGHPEANPWRDFRFKAVPGHYGRPWFLPFAGAYYRLQDLIR